MNQVMMAEGEWLGRGRREYSNSAGAAVPCPLPRLSPLECCVLLNTRFAIAQSVCACVAVHLLLTQTSRRSMHQECSRLASSWYWPPAAWGTQGATHPIPHGVRNWSQVDLTGPGAAQPAHQARHPPRPEAAIELAHTHCTLMVQELYTEPTWTSSPGGTAPCQPLCTERVQHPTPWRAPQKDPGSEES